MWPGMWPGTWLEAHARDSSAATSSAGAAWKACMNDSSSGPMDGSIPCIDEGPPCSPIRGCCCCPWWRMGCFPPKGPFATALLSLASGLLASDPSARQPPPLTRSPSMIRSRAMEGRDDSTKLAEFVVCLPSRASRYKRRETQQSIYLSISASRGTSTSTLTLA